VRADACRDERVQDVGHVLPQKVDVRLGNLAADPANVQRLYRNRFSAVERARKDEIWRVLCADFFQRYVRPTDTVLDIASGLGEFSRHIKAGRIIAVDINPDAAGFLPAGATFSLTSAERLDFLCDNSIDVAFTSNFFEHLSTKVVVDAVVNEVRRVPRPGAYLSPCSPIFDIHIRNIGIFMTITLRCRICRARRLSSLPVFELLN
jgi:ubiquinone/menaquinone biosynthesis C-methylase UbiE